MKNQAVEEPQKVQTQTFINLQKEDLIVMLKQKLKQNKILQNKNSKLETKYIDIFREHKNMKKDNSVFLVIMKTIFTNFEQKAAGGYEVEWLQQLWKKREQCFSQKLRKLMEQTAKQREQMRNEFEEDWDKKTKEQKTINQLQVEGLQLQVEDLRKANLKLMGQTSELQKQNNQQSESMSKLIKQKLKIQHQLNQFRKNEIEKQLQNTTDQNKSSEEKMTQRNQFLALRQQVQNLLSGRDDMRKQIQNLKDQLKTKNQEIQAKNKEITQLINSNNNHNNHNNSKNKKNEPKVQRKELLVRQQLKNGSDDMIHREYLKNILIRYFKSCSEGDQARSELLLNVIVTILKFNNSELNFVQMKKKSWWNLY